MNRPFGWIDLLGAALCAGIAIWIALRNAPKANGSVLDTAWIPIVMGFYTFLIFCGLFMVWGMVTSVIRPVSCALGVPNDVDYSEPVLENGTLFCKEGFTLKSGRRGSFNCQKEITRDCGPGEKKAGKVEVIEFLEPKQAPTEEENK